MPAFGTNDLELFDPADPTKRIRFDLSNLSPGVINVVKFADVASAFLATVAAHNGIKQTFDTDVEINPGDLKLAGGGAFEMQGGTGFKVDTQVVAAKFTGIDVTSYDSASVAAKFRNLSGVGGTANVIEVLDGTTLKEGIDPAGTLVDGTISSTLGRACLVGEDPPAVASKHLGKVELASQNAAIPSTNLSNGAVAGHFLVCYTIACTIADVTAGTIQFQVGYTDDVGATTQVGAVLSLAVTGRDRGVLDVELASGEISYQTNLVGAMGTALYSVRVRVIALG